MSRKTQRAVPEFDYSALSPFFGMMTLPLAITHAWFSSAATLSTFWNDVCFDSENSSDDSPADLSKPKPLDDDRDEDVELFA